MSIDNQKSAHGSIATIVWLVGTVYLFWSNFGFSSLLTWKAILFGFVGMFIAAIVIGLITYSIQLLVAKGLSQLASNNEPSIYLVNIAKFVGIILLFTDAFIAWTVVRISFNFFFLTGV